MKGSRSAWVPKTKRVVTKEEEEEEEECQYCARVLKVNVVERYRASVSATLLKKKKKKKKKSKNKRNK